MELLITMIHFMILGFSLAAPIGPMNIEVLKRGLTEGVRSSWMVGVGGLTGDILLLMGIFLGLHQFLDNQVIQLLMYVSGIAILGYLGISSIHAALFKPFEHPAANSAGMKSSYLTGLTISLANPLSLLFWFGIYGASLQGLTANYSLAASLICSFAIIFGLFLWNLQLVLAVHFSKKWLKDSVLRGITFCAGIMLLGFSGQFFMQLSDLLT